MSEDDKLECLHAVSQDLGRLREGLVGEVSMSLTRLGEALLRADVTDKGVWGALGFVFLAAEDLERDSCNENQTHHS